MIKIFLISCFVIALSGNAFFAKGDSLKTERTEENTIGTINVEKNVREKAIGENNYDTVRLVSDPNISSGQERKVSGEMSGEIGEDMETGESSIVYRPLFAYRALQAKKRRRKVYVPVRAPCHQNNNNNMPVNVPKREFSYERYPRNYQRRSSEGYPAFT